MSGKGRIYPPLAVRFADRVDKTPGHGPNGDCWLWTGCVTEGGYGQIGRGGGRGQRTDYVHRVAYELHHGVDLGRARQDGPLVLHRCDNRACVNPAHLFLGDDAENNRDMHRKDRWRPGNQAGEANPQCRLSPETVISIREHSGTYQETADAFGISIGWAWQIRNGEAWKHL